MQYAFPRRVTIYIQFHLFSENVTDLSLSRRENKKRICGLCIVNLPLYNYFRHRELTVIYSNDLQCIRSTYILHNNEGSMFIFFYLSIFRTLIRLTVT